jgi:hypothetical protein
MLFGIPFLLVLGIAGGMTNGIAYFWIVVGSSDPPGMAACRRNNQGRGISIAPPASPPSLRKPRLLIMIPPHTNDPWKKNGWKGSILVAVSLPVGGQALRMADELRAVDSRGVQRRRP